MSDTAGLGEALTMRVKRGQHAPHFLRQWREYLGKTQQEVAEFLGVTHPTIVRIESGESPLGQPHIEGLALLFGTSRGQLFDEPPPPKIDEILPLHMRLRVARLRKGWSQKELGKRLGVTGVAVHNWEKGEDVPDARRLPHLSQELEVPYDQLLDPGFEDRPELIDAARRVPSGRIKPATRLLQTQLD
jgi:transcriptional regulator with XRE-family HTH domain